MAKGISLHVGIDYVDVNHYGDEMRLLGCINDAQAMQSIADGLGYESTILLDGQATTRELIIRIRKAAESLVAGDTFFITYSGHGGQLPDLSGDEGGNDESLCLFDRQYRDDEFNRQLARFVKGVKVIWVSDSCHAANNFKNLDEDSEETEFPIAKTIGMDTAVEVIKANKKAYNDWMLDGDFLKSSTPKLPATLIQLAACKEEQLSRAAVEGESPALSAFTKQLVRVWNNGNFDGNYQQLIAQIVQMIPAVYDQTPQLVMGGQENAQLVDTKPFVY